MPLDEPRWWYRDRREIPTWAHALRPVATLYGNATARRMQAAKAHAHVPVICVGNLTAGGSGKTPLVRHLVSQLCQRGARPAVLTRGHGGRLPGPVAVAETHTAADVGDEPKLIAEDDIPVIVARRRDLGAAFIARVFPDVDVIVMDDGLQNRHLAFDLGLAAINPTRAIGNGEVIPLGPLRAPVDVQRARVDAIVITGRRDPTIDWRCLDALEPGPGRPLLEAGVRASNAEQFAGKRVFAFAGIANPERFFTLLDALNADVVGSRTFADHAMLSDADVDELIADARTSGAMLATTEKDLARLDPSRPSHARLAGMTTALAIWLTFEPRERDALDVLLDRVLKRG
ncbi:MAG: tetraacyldisaccharide 4'-kinase [Pseudomonadota bacterium]